MLLDWLSGGPFDVVNFFLGILYSLPGLLLGFTFHEFAHAYVAVKSGDETPRLMGRLTLNPLAHFDLFGVLCMIFAGFGWGKPVQIDPRHVGTCGKGRYNRWMIRIAFAGILTNIALAFVLYLLLVTLLYFVAGFSATPICLILQSAIGINIGLACFNLIPIPPLDGSKILAYTLKRTDWLYKFQQYSSIILMIFVFSGAANRVISLLANVFFWAFGMLDKPLYDLFSLLLVR